MHPQRSFHGTKHSEPYPVFRCGCSGTEICTCNAGIRRTVSSQELLVEAARCAVDYPMREYLLLNLASIDAPTLVDRIRILAEHILDGSVEFVCAIRGVGFGKCCLTNLPLLVSPKRYRCPVCRRQLGGLVLTFTGRIGDFGRLQKKLWQIIVLDQSQRMARIKVRGL